MGGGVRGGVRQREVTEGTLGTEGVGWGVGGEGLGRGEGVGGTWEGQMAMGGEGGPPVALRCVAGACGVCVLCMGHSKTQGGREIFRVWGGYQWERQMQGFLDSSDECESPLRRLEGAECG